MDIAALVMAGGPFGGSAGKVLQYTYRDMSGSSVKETLSSFHLMASGSELA